MRVYAPELLFDHGPGKAVLISSTGEIEAIADAREYPNAIPLPRRIMLPGLVNAHSHAFQRLIRGVTEEQSGEGNFWSWRAAMYRAAVSLSARDIYHVARMAFLEMALGGITTVGEFHYIHRDIAGKPYDDPNLTSKLLIQAAREVGIRICLIRVAYERAGYGKPAETLQRRFCETVGDFLHNLTALRAALDGRHAWAVAGPHSVRAVSLHSLREISEWAAAEASPIHMHVAEQPQELAECSAEYDLTPVALLERERILSPRFTAVHGIHLDEGEIHALAAHRSIVCACPATERNLGDGIVAADRLVRAGVRIALGSDSQAQIDLFEDARQLEYHLRLKRLERGIISPSVLFRCATGAGAGSLGVLPNAADFFTLDLDHPTIAGIPPEHLLAGCVFAASPSAVCDVIVGGNIVVKDHRHPLHHEVLAHYLEVCQSREIAG